MRLRAIYRICDVARPSNGEMLPPRGVGSTVLAPVLQLSNYRPASARKAVPKFRRWPRGLINGTGDLNQSVPISGTLYLNLGRLPRTSRNSLGPLRSLRLRRCRSSSVADGSLRRSISWLAISRALTALLVRTPGRWALGPCSVAMIDLHSSQMMSAASWLFLSFAFTTSNIIGCVLLQLGHQTRENRTSTSMF
jgi:hypothetical protein